MILSEHALEELVTVASLAWAVGDRARRDGAREAVSKAARELGIDPLRPPLPRFGAQESVARAAVRVLGLESVEKAIAQAQGRDEARSAHSADVAGKRARRDELVRIELARRQDHLRAGKTPPPMSQKTRDELLSLFVELLPFDGVDADRLIPYEPELGVILDALPERGLPSLVFYGELVVERLRVLTEDERSDSQAARTRDNTAAAVRTLTTGPRFYRDEALETAVRRVRIAVELADLHLLHEKHALSVEQLDAVKS